MCLWSCSILAKVMTYKQLAFITPLIRQFIVGYPLTRTLSQRERAGG